MEPPRRYGFVISTFRPLTSDELLGTTIVYLPYLAPVTVRLVSYKNTRRIYICAEMEIMKIKLFSTLYKMFLLGLFEKSFI